MAVLTAKRSNQSLFLFVLKVVFQLREAAQKSAKKPAVTRPAQSRSRGWQIIIYFNIMVSYCESLHRNNKINQN